MAHTDLDEASRAAINSLASRIRERDAMESGRLDAEVFAVEFLAVLRGQGWRPTPAKAVQPWAEQIGPPPNPGTAHRGAEMARRALAGGEVP